MQAKAKHPITKVCAQKLLQAVVISFANTLMQTSAMAWYKLNIQEM
jgi:hypothetical protein